MRTRYIALSSLMIGGSAGFVAGLPTTMFMKSFRLRSGPPHTSAAKPGGAIGMVPKNFAWVTAVRIPTGERTVAELSRERDIAPRVTRTGSGATRGLPG